MSDVDPILVAGDDGVILDENSESEGATLDKFGIVATDGGPTVRCPNSHEFDRESAAEASFDGSTACYRCPACGEWVEGPPPG